MGAPKRDGALPNNELDGAGCNPSPSPRVAIPALGLRIGLGLRCNVRSGIRTKE
jgi:hypothetical protein